ncbi:MAG: flagellar hook assembly protein FlgD [Gammaproteobacteria bacterium]|nr:flagellar hook assembly protein FlgD [Gammaproteobacteria bacterium]
MIDTVTNDFDRLGLSQSTPTSNQPQDQLGQEDFLQLMIAQFQNQDPFKPMENGDFLGQLAQFGTVSGIQDLQTSFSSLSESLLSDQTLEAAGLLDRDVLSATNTAAIENGGGISGAVELPEGATGITVSIQDEAGELVRRFQIEGSAEGLTHFTWDGVSMDGTPAVAGVYQVNVEAEIGGRTESVETLLAGRVSSISLDASGQGILLNVSGLGELPLHLIRQIG